jgi:pilus assembly protein CpaF
MFAKYKKSGKPGDSDAAPVAAVAAPSGQDANSVRRKPATSSEAPKTAAQVADGDKDVKRRLRLDEIKTEMHSRLLDNLNLSALEGAKENELRAEINAITSEQLSELGVVLNREDRQTLNVELFDEVTGLGPLEPLLKDPDVNDILVNGPNRVFVERAGRLSLTEVRFKDERHLLRIIDKIVSAVAGGSTNRTPMSTPASRTARDSTRWCRRSRSTGPSSRSVSSRKTSSPSTTWFALVRFPRKWRPIFRRPSPRAST